MFGVGPMELTIIAVVALLIFGPEKLPEMMGQAGKLVRDFRNMTAEMSGEFEKTIAEAKGITKEFQGEVGSMRNQVNSVSRSVQKDLGGNKAATATKRAGNAAKKASASSTKNSSGSKATTARKSGAKGTSSSASKGSASTSSSGNDSASASKSTTSTKPAKPQIATREDPTAAFSLFEPTEPRRQRRARKATLSAFGEATPRSVSNDGEESASELVAAVTGNGEAQKAPVDLNDPLVRARQRRQSAGYARRVS